MEQGLAGQLSFLSQRSCPNTHFFWPGFTWGSAQDSSFQPKRYVLLVLRVY